MESTTQPILCCIGQKVAGKPTQFLMERAIAAENLDWRAITVEVDADDLAAAIEGMRVMKFMAIRFLPSLQQDAMELLCESGPWLRFMGRVTSAAWSADGLVAWHNWGPGVRQWAAERVDLTRAVCWLHGNSARTRSFLLAMKQEGHSHAIVWSDAPQAIPAELEDFGEGDSAIRLHRVASGEESGLLAEFGSPQSAILIVDDISSECLHAIKELHKSIPQWLLVGGAAAIDKVRSLGLTGFSFLNEVDQTIACEAYDFQRWTGHSVEPGLLRDAYDEYCDF